ncbi:pyridoxamine 5'-phosphate oxidase [Ketogulonicigenium robustum]|uniref:Pyridoxamine 5'-phosphate oxidase n=1 Tax=Ketogulonicigenium robustum TaxID=92947 RepID=A0A1W6P2A1_9RHOB|nr:pyridoxamine 5'-phosphate oxidase family protein [Ketogulonicigenium robustum]ARO15606.1 pyridoxamine 5'-phosphate oxidase [Ketogulonicigenium robustum]
MQDDAITPRPAEIDPEAGTPFDAVACAQDLLFNTPAAALSTLDPGGYPYGTVTNLAVMPDGTPIFFAAGLALHARNIAVDNRISLVMAPFGVPDLLTKPRLTLVGRAIAISKGEDEAERAVYLARFTKAKLYLQLPDAIMYRMDVESLQLNGGPTRNASALTPAILRQPRP